jgi:hypothetical protein
MFWDNRAQSLEAQAMGPTSALNEIRGASFDEATIFPEIVTRLSALPAYVAHFDAVFGVDGITKANITRAIATFERTLVDTDSSYDRYVLGDATALTAEQLRGLDTFGRSGCTRCHSGAMFSDYQLHRIASNRSPVRPIADEGAGNGTFRTASLRNVARTCTVYARRRLRHARPGLRALSKRRLQRRPEAPRSSRAGRRRSRGLHRISRSPQRRQLRPNGAELGAKRPCRRRPPSLSGSSGTVVERHYTIPNTFENDLDLTPLELALVALEIDDEENITLRRTRHRGD